MNLWKFLEENDCKEKGLTFKLELDEEFLDKFEMTEIGDGIRYRFAFENGKGASVVKTSRTYGSEHDLWEVAVLDERGHIDYTTSITKNVVGYLDNDSVNEILHQIESL